MKNKVFGNQIKEEKLEIFISVPYRSNLRGRGRKEFDGDTGKQRWNWKTWGISSKSKSNSTDEVMRWSLENLRKKLPKLSFVWPKGKRKKIKINWNSQLSCVQDNKQTNKQISKMTPRFKRARRKKLKFQLSCKSVHKQRNGRGFSENAESAWAKSWASCAVIGRNKKFTTRKRTRFSQGIWSSFKCCVFVIGCAWNWLIYR